MTRLLIIAPAPLVGTVHGLQVATSLKAQWPAEKAPLQIDWVARDMLAPLVQACTAVDHVHIFKRHGGMLEFMRLLRELRRTTYDYVFDFQGLLRSGLITLSVQSPRKIGRQDARERAETFYNEKVPLPVGGRRSHELDILLQFLTVLGCNPELHGSLQFRGGDTFNLSHVDGPKKGRLVLMFPDSNRPQKRWPGFPELTDLILRSDRSWRVVWAGENYLPDQGVHPAEGRFLNLSANTSMLSLAALIRRAEWVISNESGAMHLAAALGVRTLGIFGPSDPRRYGPYPMTAATNHIIQAPVGNLSMLSSKDVFARFQKLVDRAHSGSPATQ